MNLVERMSKIARNVRGIRRGLEAEINAYERQHPLEPVRGGFLTSSLELLRNVYRGLADDLYCQGCGQELDSVLQNAAMVDNFGGVYCRYKIKDGRRGNYADCYLNSSNNSSLGMVELWRVRLSIMRGDVKKYGPLKLLQ